MQVILTFIVVAGAVILFIIKGMKALKAFKKADHHCKGCGSTCEGCPVAPGNRRNRS